LRTFGHHAGVNALKRTITAAVDLGITHLTVFAFSTENWKRPASEINELMGLLKAFIKADLAQLHQKGVRIRIIGRAEGLGDDIKACVDEAQTLTKENRAFNLQVALNYGARADIIDAAKAIAVKIAAGDITPDVVDEALFAQNMATHGLPPLDLLIRTSGEHRLSNFLLWECAYSEFVFQDILWPDYGHDALKDALDIYARRERRFGAIEAGHVKQPA
jgi:undecaprenyl diphosphate synthase